MRDTVTFFVPGIPVPQGSKTLSRSGFMYEANKNLKPWRQDVVALAQQAMRVNSGDLDPFRGPVRVYVKYEFPRPKGHYRTGRNAHLLKEWAPVWHTTKPDTDKLQRALGDALTIAGVLKDDSQICAWDSTKYYCDTIPEHPGMTVKIVPLEHMKVQAA